MTPRKAALSEEDEFAAVAKALKQAERKRVTPLTLGFVAFMAMLAIVFFSLGQWQMNRLHEKEALIAAVEDKLGLAPVALPPPAEWLAFDADVYNFRHVKVTGRFLPEQTVLVFTSLDNANGSRQGPGYWVVTPFALETGGTVFVNRGFVPQTLGQQFGVTAPAPDGLTAPQTISGIARASEEANSFTPGPELSNRIEYVRNVDRLAAQMPQSLSPFAPIYIDQEATDAELPQGGETKVSFPNRHYEYALTWFSLAGVTVLMTLIWLWRRRGLK